MTVIYENNLAIDYGGLKMIGLRVKKRFNQIIAGIVLAQQQTGSLLSDQQMEIQTKPLIKLKTYLRSSGRGYIIYDSPSK